MAISNTDRKKLRDRAGGECSFPGCAVREPLEEAHIRSPKKDGPRHDPRLVSPRVDAYDNRVILCPNHHTTVDVTELGAWTIDRLEKMKAAHEADVSQRGSRVTEFQGHVKAMGVDADSVTGAVVKTPTSFGPGSRIEAEGIRTRKITGLQIGGDEDG